jgi:hypothetical protein
MMLLILLSRNHFFSFPGLVSSDPNEQQRLKPGRHIIEPMRPLIMKKQRNIMPTMIIGNIHQYPQPKPAQGNICVILLSTL